MAVFEYRLPEEVIKDLEKIYKDADKIFGGMTKAGAEVTLKNVKSNVPASWRKSKIMNNIGITDVYKTPTDGGINTKVIISGYFINHLGVKTPAPLVANVFEYGRSNFPKKPFFRKSFRKAEIERAMIKAQKELSGGVIDE